MGRRIAAWTAVVLVVPAAVVAVAQPAGAVDFFPTGGGYAVDTTTLTITGPGGATLNGADVDGVAVFAFDSVSIPADVALQVRGSRPFRLQASGNLSVGGVINGDGTSAADFTALATPGGPGGGSGGAPGSPGAGPGAGSAPADVNHGGGGGGFGGAGARGGPGASTGVGGPVYGPLSTSFQGGSGGGGTGIGGLTAGGGGGGALALVGSTVVVASTAVVSADGGGGAAGGFGASGGGSGGAIVLQGDTVEVAGTVRARGGPGGAGGCCGAGGGGGGGRIALRYADSLTVVGTTSVAGGQSGFRSTSGCCGSGGIGDPVGVAGALTSVHGSASSTGPALTIPFGTAATVGTVLSDTVTDQPLPGRQVDLFRRALPSGSWELVGTFPTTATGAASATVSPGGSTEYQWRYAGTETQQPATSGPQRVSVAQVVSLSTTRARPAPGTTYTLWGKVRPSGAGETVRLQRRVSGTWRTIATATLKRQKLPSGTAVGYVFTRTAKRGTWTYRVLKPATATLLKDVSPVVVVKVG